MWLSIGEWTVCCSDCLVIWSSSVDCAVVQSSMDRVVIRSMDCVVVKSSVHCVAVSSSDNGGVVTFRQDAVVVRSSQVWVGFGFPVVDDKSIFSILFCSGCFFCE